MSCPICGDDCPDEEKRIIHEPNNATCLCPSCEYRNEQIRNGKYPIPDGPHVDQIMRGLLKIANELAEMNRLKRLEMEDGDWPKVMEADAKEARPEKIGHYTTGQKDEKLTRIYEKEYHAHGGGFKTPPKKPYGRSALNQEIAKIHELAHTKLRVEDLAKIQDILSIQPYKEAN